MYDPTKSVNICGEGIYYVRRSIFLTDLWMDLILNRGAYRAPWPRGGYFATEYSRLGQVGWERQDENEVRRWKLV